VAIGAQNGFGHSAESIGNIAVITEGEPPLPIPQTGGQTDGKKIDLIQPVLQLVIEGLGIGPASMVLSLMQPQRIAPVTQVELGARGLDNAAGFQ